MDPQQNTSPLAAPKSSAASAGPPLTRRSLLGKSLVFGVGVSVGPWFLSACGNSSNTSSGPATIKFAALTDQTGEQTNEINTFNTTNKDKIKVDYVELPPVATDQYNKFVDTFKAKSSDFDVVQIDVTWPAQFATPGWLAPLDKYVNADYLKQFWPSAVDVGKVNGKQYGIQRFMDVGMLYYRTDLNDKYGGGKAPATRAEMEATAQKVMQGESSNGVQYGYIFEGKKIEAITDEWLEFLWGNGGDIGEPGNLKVNSDKGVEALTYMHDLIYKLKLAPDGTNTYAPNDALALFQDGKAPFMRNWTYAYALLQDPAKSKVVGKVGVAPTLATQGNQGHGCTGGWVLAISNFSKNKDASWKFIDYMLSKETQKSMAVNAKLISSRPDVVNDPDVQAKVAYFKQLGNILNTGKNRPKLENYNQFTTPMQAAINLVLSNQGSAQDQLNAVQSQVANLK